MILIVDKYIDAQITWQGKVFSADALLQGMEKIKMEVEKTGVLNKAYIPILQGMSPGELQSAENALKFAKELVTKWLAHYKFKNWEVHSSTGVKVTEDEKQKRAVEIADALCNHRSWLTHGRSIKLEDLQKMGLLVTDYSKQPDLAEAIGRYYTLLHLTFATNIYKVFETPVSQIYKFMVPNVGAPVQQMIQGPQPMNVESVDVEVECSNCKKKTNVQAHLGKKGTLKAGSIPFPGDDKFRCPNCGSEADLSDARRQIEAQTKARIVSQGEENMENARFKIIFEKMVEDSKDEETRKVVVESKELEKELDEISELRRFVSEITESEPQLYTNT